MITSFRRLSKTWFAGIIVGLLIIGLAVVGMFDPMRFDFSSYVIKAGDREVSQQQYRQIIDNLNERNAQMTGQRFTMAELVEAGQHIQILESLAGEESLFAWAWKVGIRPARDLVAAQLRQQQAFFDPVTGQFSEEAMGRALSETGMTPAIFEDTLRHQIAAEHYVAGAAAGLRMPRVYGAIAAAYAGETRNGRWILLSPSDIRDVPNPTDAQLTTLLNELAEQVREPEFRTVTMVRFTPALAAANIQISDQAIQDRFNFQRESLGTPETRSFVTLTAPNAEAAQTIARRLRAGEDPAAVARSLNIEPVNYAGQPRSAVPDARVAQAAFGLAQGAVSDPVQGELGLVVIKVTAIAAGREATLAEHRQEIENALRLEQARVRVTEMVEQFVALREGGTGLREAATQVGGVVATLPPFTEEGMLPNGQPMGAPEVLYQTAFDTAEGSDSDVVDAGQDEYFAIHVDEVRESRMPTINELRPQLVQFWRGREIGRRLQERGNALAERVRGGEDIAAVARAEGLTLTTRTGVGRGDGEGETASLPADLVGGLFGQAPGQVFSGPADREGRFVVGVVDRATAPAAVLAGRQAEGIRPQMTGQAFQAEYVPAMQAAARTAVRTEVFPDRARAALGVPAEETPAGE
ncbi:peptidylprolyl isomerase [Brevundimonas aveniformis]|uniref:peptidylprolyl isomerase n=1 Tax=Brevundimonas aveniformis TaxID=370977 RepID=UPI000421CD8B|nr:SurA N-terminal domain-containing protein [Brevundimonas aveniformis]